MKKTLIYFLLSLVIVACSGGKKATSDEKVHDTAAAVIELSEKEKVIFGNAYIEGAKEKILENYEKSKKHFQAALAINPKSAAAHYELGLVYKHLKQNDEAFQQFEIATDLEPSNYWYKLSYASSFQSQGQINKAIEAFKDLVELKPRDLKLKKELSQLLLGEERYKESLKYINQIEDEIGVNEDITFLKQQIHLKNDDVDAAADEMKKLIEAYPDRIEYYGILADIYLTNKKEKEAFKVYKEMEEIDPDNYLVQFSLAEYYRSQGIRDQYLIALDKAFSNSKMKIDEKVKYVLTFYQVEAGEQEKKAEGILLCKTIVEAHPNNPKSHALLADFLYFDNQREAAKQSYIKTIGLDSSRFPVWNQLLIIMSETQDQEGLLNYGQRAVNLFPNQPTVFFLYGLGLADAKRHEEAIDYLKMAKDLVLDNKNLKSQIYSSIGDSYHALKEYEKSDKHYELALEIDPNNIYVLNNYSYYLSLRKEKMDRAEQMSRKANELAPGQASFQDTYAWILYQSGKYEEANEWIDKALKSDKESSGVLLEHKGDILFRLGKKTQAVTYWKKAAKKDDASDEIHKKVEAGESYVFEE